MSEYKRFTERRKGGYIETICNNCEYDHNYLCTETEHHCFQATKNRLCELEDKIESGRLVELPFTVIDKQTKKEADEYKIALEEDWAKFLCYCDMDGFAITQDGNIILLDECGKYAYCPRDRFEIITEARLKELQEEQK